MNYHQLRQVFQNRKKDWNKTIWIARKLSEKEDDYGNSIPVYEKPQKYEMNVQPISSSVDIKEFGENANLVQKTVIEYNKYFGKFKEFDVAYLDGANPTGEKVHGENANYRLYSPRNQNRVIVIYFERLVQGKSMQSS